MFDVSGCLANSKECGGVCNIYFGSGNEVYNGKCQLSGDMKTFRKQKPTLTDPQACFRRACAKSCDSELVDGKACNYYTYETHPPTCRLYACARGARAAAYCTVLALLHARLHAHAPPMTVGPETRRACGGVVLRYAACQRTKQMQPAGNNKAYSCRSECVRACHGPSGRSSVSRASEASDASLSRVNSSTSAGCSCHIAPCAPFAGRHLSYPSRLPPWRVCTARLCRARLPRWLRAGRVERDVRGRPQDGAL